MKSAAKKPVPVKQVTCGHCGQVAPFGPGWRWPSIGIDAGYYDDRTRNPVCSDACEAKLRERPGLAKAAP